MKAMQLTIGDSNWEAKAWKAIEQNLFLKRCT